MTAEESIAEALKAADAKVFETCTFAVLVSLQPDGTVLYRQPQLAKGIVPITIEKKD